MRLSEVLAIFPQVRIDSTHDVEVRSICFDSRKLNAGCLFVAIRGGSSDGHLFLAQAASQGAVALVVEDKSMVPSDYRGVVVQVQSTRLALNLLAAQFYAHPSRELFSVGITGTNGKTTVSNMIEAILNRHGWPTGVIGTIDHHLGARVWPTELTTPDAVLFQERLREFVNQGARAVALEASSHALTQARVDSVEFDVAVFTNLTRDHLDYHKDMEDYFLAKARLFTELLASSNKNHRRGIINADDPYGPRLKAAQVPNWTYGAHESADLYFSNVRVDFTGTYFQLRTPHGEQEIFLQMVGLHNIYNSVAAIGAALVGGVSLGICAAALADLKGVSGRLQAVPNTQGLNVFIDFAHTDAALESVLRNLQSIRQASGTKGRIITLFGCGGDRDRGKRPMMMQAALKFSDLVVLTSDNPRTEDPAQILRDALVGVAPQILKDQVIQEIDRKAAIGRALAQARPGDIILIAGKGHERYQQIGNVKIEFSDFEVAKGFLS
jgi:UDP-N-acetylmuramoyl-L-alanyl-D-glutamate--2,6-diaminopimelate ligase